LAKDSFLWRHFSCDDAIGTVIVPPSLHGDDKSDISYSDALAIGEVYAKLRKVKDLKVGTHENLGDEVHKNLILIGGKKVNPIAKDFQFAKEPELDFYLDDGVIYDKERHVVLTPTYIKGEKRTVENVTVDYGLITYTDNPFGKCTKLLHIAGIKGCGTLAAAIASVEDTYNCRIKKIIAEQGNDTLNKTVQVLVKVSATNGRIKHESISIEKIKLHRGAYRWQWESEAYRQLRKAPPRLLYVDMGSENGSRASLVKVRIDDQEIKFARSPDRLKIIYILAKQARQDYVNQTEGEGWLNAFELAERLWRIKHRNGVTEIPAEIRREIAREIITWVRNLQKLGKLKFEESIRLDHDYVNSEILVSDFDVKKKIVDLVYSINQDRKNNVALAFQLIESRPGLGYRLNIHPALIFLNEPVTIV
jgi:hypothetical protein